MIAAANRLRRHGDYQRVYNSSRKRFGKQMSYFAMLRQPQSKELPVQVQNQPAGPRVGLTVSRAMGKAVDRNRIKRRMREAVRRHLAELNAPVDVILHPQRRAATIEFALLERDVAEVFRAIQHAHSAAPQASRIREGGK